MTVTKITPKPMDVVCPECKAAITAQCTEKNVHGFGMMFVEMFHPSRYLLSEREGNGRVINEANSAGTRELFDSENSIPNTTLWG